MGGVGALGEPAVDPGAGLVEELGQPVGGVADGPLQRFPAAVEVLVHALVDLVDPTAQARLHDVDALAQRAVHGAGQAVQPAVLLVQVVIEVVDALVDARDAVLEAVHPAGDSLEPPGHAVEPPVELGERLGQPVDDSLD